ncbi:MAG: gliding motility-associated C-terminal domain-containing protein [Cyclobacteriaceae bacterium]
MTQFRIIGIVLILFLFTPIYSQNLIGILNNNLVIIDSVTAEIELQHSLSSNESLVDLTYHNLNQRFYSIKNNTSNPSLISISKTGELEEIGALTLSGTQIPLAESIAYNQSNSKLYIGVSIDGGVSSGDFYSESIVEVDPSTGICTLITQIQTDRANPDIDVMAFVGNKLYMFDGAPPNANFTSFYEYDFGSISSIINPVSIYDGSYIPIRDFAANSLHIYFIAEYNLYRFNISTKNIESIGATHTSSEFGGEFIQGLSKTCNLSKLELGADTIICNQSPLLLDATYESSSYRWQDGSIESTLQVTQTGTYWVHVENSCGIVSDTIRVEYQSVPVVDLGPDQNGCISLPVMLNASFSESTYKWNDGSILPTFSVENSGTYWVEVANECGIDRDTIHFSVVTSPPSIELGENRKACNIDTIVLNAYYPQSTYLWSDGSTDSVLVAKSSGTYSVEVSNECGVASDAVELSFPNTDDIQIPNVFTPNGDSKNEYFMIDQRLIGSTIKIYQRTGSLIFESLSYQNDWNGSGFPSGTYFYFIEDDCQNEYKGWVTILY